MNSQTVIRLTKNGSSVFEVYTLVQRFLHKLGYVNTGYKQHGTNAVYFREEIFNQTIENLFISISKGPLVEVSIDGQVVKLYFTDQTANKYPFLKFIQQNKRRLEELRLTVELPSLEET